MRILFDENFEQSIVEHFRTLGHDVVSVGTDEPGVTDEVILARARRERRVIVTNDLDFGALIYHRGLASAGVILVRLGALPLELRLIVLTRLFDRWSSKFARSFTVINRTSIRIRPLLPNR